MLAVVALILLTGVPGEDGRGAASALAPAAPARLENPSPTAQPIFVVYYWKARPGKAAAYAEYIRTVAEPIDEEARKAGVFEEVHTYTPAIVTGAPGADWTHMRVFKLKSLAAWEAFGAGMDEATRRIYPDEARRSQIMEPAADLRDLLRQEIWREFK
jgi:hypothetical protein